MQMILYRIDYEEEKMKTVDLNEVYNLAGERFRNGDFFCSEAIVSTIRDVFDPNMPIEIISTASGFPVGVGRQKCMCGAISGGVIALGYFFGRTQAGDTKVNKTLELTSELHQTFREKNKVACCSILTKGMDMAAGEHKDQCVRFTSEMAKETARIIAREKNISITEN